MATPVVTALNGRFLIADGPLALDQNDTAQSLPLRQVLKPAKLLRGPDASHFESAVFTPIDRLVKGVFDFSKVCSSRIGKEIFDFLSSRSLIAFEAHNVVSVLINNRLRDVPLASHGVDRNGGSSDIQEFKKPRNGSNLVGFLFGRDLTERQLVVRDPGAHYMQCLLACRAIE